MHDGKDKMWEVYPKVDNQPGGGYGRDCRVVVMHRILVMTVLLLLGYQPPYLDLDQMIAKLLAARCAHTNQAGVPVFS